MFKITRRSILRSTGIAGLASVTAAVFPELSPLAAFAKSPEPTKPWFMETAQSQEEATEAQLTASSDLLPRLRRFAGGALIDEGQPAKVVVSTKADGSTVTAWARPIDQQRVAAVYTERDSKGRLGRSQALIWEVAATTKSGRLVQAGSSLESLTPVRSAHNPGMASAHAIDCGTAAYPCSICVSFDSSFTDCCIPCIFSFGDFWWGVACVSAWCVWCIGEHCTGWTDSCCTG